MEFNNKNIFYTLLVIGVILLSVFFGFFNKNNEDITTHVEKGSLSNTQEQKYISSSELQKSLDDFHNISVDTKYLDKNQISEISNLMRIFNDSKKVSELDNAIITFLKNKDISRLDKIRGLWSMIENFGISSNKGLFLLDYLGTLEPIELTDNLINIYCDQQDSVVKLKIIDVLVNSINIASPDIQDEKELAFIAGKSVSIESLLYDEVLNSTDEYMLSKTLMWYANVSSPERVQDIISIINNRDSNIKIEGKKLVPILTRVAISTQDAVENILPTIFASIDNGSFSQPEIEAFNETILSALNSDVCDNILMHSATKNYLINYLSKQEPKINLSNDISIYNLIDYHSWANANAKVNDIDASEYFQDMVLANKNALKISSILLLYADESFIQDIKQHTDIEDTYDTLSSALESSETHESSKALIQRALDRIKK